MRNDLLTDFLSKLNEVKEAGLLVFSGDVAPDLSDFGYTLATTYSEAITLLSTAASVALHLSP